MLARLSRGIFNRATQTFRGPQLQQTNVYSYIQQKKLDQIKEKFDDGSRLKLKMYKEMGKYIGQQGFGKMKKDAQIYPSLRNKLKTGNTELTQAESELRSRLWDQMNGLATLLFIQIMPFSGPLFMFYVYAYPLSLPTYFRVDAAYEDFLRKCIKNQAIEMERYNEKPLEKDFVFNKLSLQELKRISILLFGHYEDGLTGYKRIRPDTNAKSFLHPIISKSLIKMNIRKLFKKETYYNTELKGLSMEDLIRWKKDKVIKGDTIKFKPVFPEENEPVNEDNSQEKK